MVRCLLNETRQRLLEQGNEDSRKEGDQSQILEDRPKVQTPLPRPSAKPDPLGLAEPQQEAWNGWIPLLAPGGTTFIILIELSTIITQLQREMGVVEEKLNTNC